MKNPVGLSKIRYRWYVLYNTGESKPVSYLWNIVPKTIRTYLLWRRRHEQTKHELSFNGTRLSAYRNGAHNISKYTKE